MRILLAILVLVPAAFAQDTPPVGEQAFAAFARAQAIVFDQEQFRRDLPEVWGVSVTLRQGPRRFTADSMAFDQARIGLIDAVAREVEKPTEENAENAKLTVELAGRPSAIEGERGLADVALAIRPGLDAVAVRAGDSSAVVFPDAALAGAMLPTDMVVAALREARGDRLPVGIADEPGAWDRYADVAVRQGEAAVYRAPVTVLAQPNDALAPVLVHRGGRVVSMGELTPDALEGWAAGMADHLQRRRYGGLEPYGLRGTLDALRGEPTTPLDTPFNQALAAHALMRYGTSNWAPEDSASRARTGGVVLLRQLALVTPVRIDAMAGLGDEAPLEPEPWGTVASAAMVLIAMDSLEADAFELYPELAAMRERCAQVVRPAVSLSITGSAVFDTASPVTAYALIARAMVALGNSDIANQADSQIGRAAARAIVARVEPEVLVPQMPWLLAALGDTEQLTGADALQRMRGLVWEHQLEGPAVEGDNRDLAGGIVFTRGGVPLPTWQTARAASAMGSMLLDPRLTPADQRAGEFLRMLKTLRFLRQLTVDDSLGHLLADPDLAAGGVRAALWDQRQPSVATSLTLMAVCDALDTAYQP
ncbi:MAG: hypothetical protein NCW75_00920 [Phycisphaera sp.]|nr:MAG: hypothetical protein NCW75_00920 [Phycisphaera sp.]